MNEEIKLTKRKPTWNYILNDLALYSLMTKVIHSEVATYQDKFDFMYQIELLQKQNTDLKEKITLLKASEPMLEFAKQTYKDNWNKLKEWLEEEIKYDENWYKPECKEYIGQKRYSDDTIDGFNYVLEKLQEIEGGMNENAN